MTPADRPRSRVLTIVAQDPAIVTRKGVVTTRVEVPVEDLAPGPWGYRVQVIDYDATARALHKPLRYPPPKNGRYEDPFEGIAGRDEILATPQFHCQNVYAIVMRILARFEQALGRRVGWSFYPHQIKVAPHAFADANAFYSEKDESLLFGYFPGRKGTVFSCLSHDVVAHETTHALIDGLRTRYTDPSSPDQAAFHEGFSDVVALLSVFALKDVVGFALDHRSDGGPARGGRTVAKAEFKAGRLRSSILFGLAKELGEELSSVRGRPLRRSAELSPSPRYYRKEKDFEEPHRRGEILVAAMLNAFIEVWSRRALGLREVGAGQLDRERVVEEGAAAADYLLTMSIRALDYCSPVHIEFGDFLSALLTADGELRPSDVPYGFRAALLGSFEAYGILPAGPGEAGTWTPAEGELDGRLSYDRSHFEPLQNDAEEVFRFIWENRRALKLYDGAFSRVLSVRPCLRIGPDGFALRETVAEFYQKLTLQARELKALKIDPPPEMPKDQEVHLYGGGTLIFDEFGRLKFNIHNRIDNRERQTTRLAHLWRYGHFARGASLRRRFSALHRLRAQGAARKPEEEWI